MNNVLREGNIVGFHEGKVSAVTKGCRLVGVVTERAAVVGSKASLGTAAAAAGVTVAYCGRVPITVIGPVKTGAVLIPSGPSTFKPPPNRFYAFQHVPGRGCGSGRPNTGCDFTSTPAC